MRGAWKGWVVVAGLCAAPVSLAATVVEPRARLTLEERYDDDFRLNLGGTGGQLMTKLAPRFGLEVKEPTFTAEGFYAADLLVRHGSGKVTLDHRGGLRVEKELSRRLRMELSGRLFRVTDPTSLPRESVARSAQPLLYGEARAYAVGRLTRRVDVAVGYELEGARVLEGDAAAGLSHTPYVEAWLRASRRLTLGAGYRYQVFLFGGDSARAHGLFAGLGYRLTRQLRVDARVGPVSYAPSDGTQGVLPWFRLVLQHDGELLDVAVIAGHDLVGASGFISAVWADHARVMVQRRFHSRLSAYAAGSFFRNGRVPGEGAFTLRGGAGGAQGYALGAGLELEVNPYLSLQVVVERISQMGVDEAEEIMDLARNVAAARLRLTAW
ncbi:MAG TPA: hypothetical protein VLQ93_11940 [Myxococcaceae bacterium]|nr:hypothetical protein [Myxococcaceae bacterium]